MKVTKYYLSFRTILVLFFIFGNFLVCKNVIASTPLLRTSQSNGESSIKIVLKHLLPILKESGKVGRIYYQSKCQPGNDSTIPFPLMKVQSPPQGDVGLAAVREIFQKNANVKMIENQPGIISIIIGRPSFEILNTKISTITLTPVDQYNYLSAFNAIENNEEVQTAMLKYGFSVPSVVSNELIVQPANGLPHLPSLMANVTMDQALNLVARTFKGTVIYGSCGEPRIYSIAFVGGVYFDESKLQ